MRVLLPALALAAALLPGATVPAAAPGARHTTGAVTIRGVAHHVHSRDFTLQTASRGSYTVDTSPPTTFVETGHSGKPVLVEGDHVGVRGILHGTHIRAIQVRIYPTQLKQETLRGTVKELHGSTLTIQAGSKTVAVRLTSGTVIRTSSATVAASALHPGDRVDVRVLPSGHGYTALHIHLYVRKPVLRHVELRGTVTSATGTNLTIASSGRRYAVGVTSGTRFYGHVSGGVRSLRPGTGVTVYACCAGHPLVATSIHVRAAVTSRVSVELRGHVIAISPTAIHLDAQHGIAVSLVSSTVYEVGSSRVGRTGVLVGDEVSVRAYRSGSVLRATRVHVYASFRSPHTLRGTVSSVSASALTVTARGVSYTVRMDGHAAVRLSGRAARAGDLRRGDHVRATGRLDGHQLLATRLDATRPAAKTRLVRGAVTQVRPSQVVIVDGSGKTYTVRLTSGTRISMQGKSAPATSLFPGAHVSARGTLSGSVLAASTLTVTAKTRTASGRVLSVTPSALLVRSSSGRTVRVDLPSGMRVADGSHHLAPSAIHVGASLRASGYAEPSRAIRATALTIIHPAVDARGILAWSGGTATVRTSGGETYALRFASPSVLRSIPGSIALRPSELPAGASVHVRGSLGSDGAIAVTSLLVHLQSVTLRATVSAIASKELTVGGQRVRLEPATTFAQGSKTVALTDLVVGDDVTVYGYRLGSTTVLSRRILVHRRLLAIDGTVASIDGNAFTLTAADGPHQVLVSPATIVSGPAGAALATGMQIHVTGYLRGDGVVLATRLRMKSTPTPPPKYVTA